MIICYKRIGKQSAMEKKINIKSILGMYFLVCAKKNIRISDTYENLYTIFENRATKRVGGVFYFSVFVKRPWIKQCDELIVEN